MPYKHQADSYRVIDGRRWESWGDFNAEASKSERDALKLAGWMVRRVNIGGGMYRIFRVRANSYRREDGPEIP